MRVRYAAAGSYWLVAAALYALPQAQQAETKPEDRCTLEGQILNAATGEPIRKANLVLRKSDMPPGMMGVPVSYVTASDAGGNFAMKDLEPGKYRLSVTRTGYVNTEYGARGPLRPGATLSLERGQHMKEVVIRMTPHGVLTGRVVDEDGEPVANVQVQAMRYRYNGGRKQLMPFGGASTNDLGEYRLFGMAPGKYYLSATYRPIMMFEAAADRSANAPPEEDYVPVYYPGTADPGAASAVEVTPGGQLRGIDFTLSKTRTVRLRGRVVNAAAGGAIRRNVMLSLVPRDRPQFFGMNRPTASDPSGNFEIRGVSPGAYYLMATIYDGERTVSGKQPVDVGHNNIENLAITVGAGVELSGRVRVEGDAPAVLTDVRVMLRPRDQNALQYGPTPDGRVKEDGSFTLSRVGADQYTIVLMGLPDGFYVKAIRAGDEEVLASGLDLNRGPAGAIDILISPNAGRVEGTVQNGKQQPAAGATVVLIPQDERRHDQMQFFKSVTTDQYGRFALKNVDPGQYKAYAWEDLEPGAFMDPDFVKPVESKGETVSVDEKGNEALQLKLIPAEAGATPDGAPHP